MTTLFKVFFALFLSATLAACTGSDSNSSQSNGTDTTVAIPGEGTGAPTLDDSPVPGADTGGTDTDGTDTGGTDTGGTDTGGTDTGGTDTSGTDTSGTDTSGTDTGGTDTGGTDTGGTDTSGTDTSGTDTSGTDTSGPIPIEPVESPANPNLGSPQVPTLADPTAPAIASPNREDPFGFGLDFDGEPAVVGGPPTQPKNLRLELVSNNWAELNWAPSNDDGQVVQYTIQRDDGVVYIIRGDQIDPSAAVQDEINKYWETTSFIDCNFTRFDQRLHACGDGRQPIPGTTYIYTVTALDNDGQESVASEPLSITYLLDKNAPVPNYNDFFRNSDDSFVQDNDLSAPSFYLNNGFKLVFQDEFNGPSLDLNKWQTRLTWGDETIINGEQQYFVNTQDDPDFGYDPFRFTGTSMIIEAVPVSDELRPNLPPSCDDGSRPGVDQCEFLSGAISSFDRFSFLYGYTEGRFKVSGAAGALSTFYLYHRYKGTGTSFHAPEIDIMEYLGDNPFGDEDAFQTYHYESPSSNGVIKRSAPTMAAANPEGIAYGDDGQWHTFSVLWEPQLVIWYIDGVEIKRLFGPQVARRPMNVISYLVTGSEWAPTPDKLDESLFPMKFEVDYIRVYQRGDYVGNAEFGTSDQ